MPSCFRPPALTPGRERPKRTSAAEEAASPAVPLTPHSPIAVAARAVSQEESVRSTLRMKRAAEAIAREDAQIIVSLHSHFEEARCSLMMLPCHPPATVAATVMMPLSDAAFQGQLSEQIAVGHL